MTSRTGIIIALASLGLSQILATEISGDGPLESGGKYPYGFHESRVDTNAFNGLRAEALAGRLKIFASPRVGVSLSNAVVFFSADTPGGWPGRDWRLARMVARGARGEATIPVDDVQVPIVYFVGILKSNTLIASEAVQHLSPMRVVSPERVGFSEPTEFFWAFRDGFEEDLTGWRLLSPEVGYDPLDTTAEGHSGRHALRVRLPPGKRSVAVGTTRIRGRHLVQHGGRGLQLWVRTRTGEGRARFSLWANAMTPAQSTGLWPASARVSPEWQKVTLMFADLPKFTLAGVDFFSVEMIGQGPLEFQLDDLLILTGRTGEGSGPFKRGPSQPATQARWGIRETSSPPPRTGPLHR